MTDEIQRNRILEQLCVLRAQTGDSEALCQLFQNYNGKLLYYLRRLLGDATEAEDTLQEVWLSVLRSISRLNEPPAFRTWLYRIARNHAISRLRRKRVHVDLDAIDESNLAEPAEAIEDGFVLSYDAASVHRVMGELSPSHREVLTLRFLEQLSYEEISQVVGCSVGTVRSRIYYAKARLGELLSQRTQDR